MASEIELHIESEEILPKPRICVDEDGNLVVWTYIADKDLPSVHSFDENARLF